MPQRARRQGWMLLLQSKGAPSILQNEGSTKKSAVSIN